MIALPAALSPARLSLALVGLAWTVPFLQPRHAFPLTSFYSEWLAFIFGLAAASLLAKRELWRGMTLPAVALYALAGVGVLIAQAALGRAPYPEQALVAMLYLVWAAALIVLGDVLRRELGTAGVARTLAWFLLAGGLLSAVVAVLQHYRFSTPLDFLIAAKTGRAVYGNLAQPNHFASYGVLALGSAAYLVGVGALRAAVGAGCAALLLFTVTISGSRSAWVYLAALALLAWWLWKRDKSAAAERLFFFCMLLLPAMALMQWAARLPFLLPAEGGMETSAQRLFEAAAGIGARLQLWREAWWMFLEAPLLGLGFGQFAWHHFEFHALFDTLFARELFNHAHNLVLQLLAETGLVGTALALAGTVVWLVGFGRVAFTLERWWIAAALAVIGIHSMLELPLWYAYFLGIAAVLAGLGAAQRVALTAQRSGCAAMIVMLVFGWWSAFTAVQGYRSFERLVFTPYRQTSDVPPAEKWVEQLTRLHREPLLTPYVEFALAFGIEVSEEALGDKLALNSRVMRFAPADTVVYRQALLLALAGDSERAAIQLQHAIRVYPGGLRDAVAALQDLTRRFPGRFGPLLELATSMSAGSDAPRAVQY